MAGTQGSSYSSPDKAAAGNARTTSNLRSGLNASGSSKTNSGYGSRPASSSVNAAAANAARTAAERAASTAASQRTATSQGGYGPSRPASANVNAAAARASMMNNQRAAGLTQSYGGKGDAFGANQTVSKGINMSAGDMLAGGYGAYNNPSAGLAMAARPNTSVYGKGTNLSSGDLLAGGYRSYQQPPSMQSTPQTAGGGWNDLAGLQAAVAGMNPTFGNIVSGTLRSPLGKVTSNGEIGGANWEQTMMNGGYGPTPSQIASIDYGQTPLAKDMSRVPSIAEIAKPENYNWGGPPNLAALNANGMNQAFNVNSMPKVAMEGGIPGGISPDSVPNLPNYASPVSVANREPSPYDSPTQFAGYQNPARAFPSRPAPTQTAMNSPMAGQGVSFSDNRYSMPAAGYNQEIVRALANQRAVNAGLLGNAGTDTFGKYAPGQVAEAPASAADPSVTTDYGLYDQTPTLGQQLKAGAINYLDKKTAPIKSGGDLVNGLLGGTSQNNPNWQAPGNPNARDQLNNLAEKTGTTKTKATAEQIKQAVEDGKADPEYKTLSAEKKQLIAKYVREGMTYAEAKAKALGGTTGGGTGTGGTVTRPAVYYPQYYSTWAGLPSGQRYG